MKNKTITYISTASRAEKLGFFVRIGKWRLKRLGLVVDELEISTAPYEVIVSKLEKNGFIYVTGCNTFFLLQELRRTGADKILIREIEQEKRSVICINTNTVKDFGMMIPKSFTVCQRTAGVRL